MSKFNVVIEEDHLCVISDLHLGNPSFMQKDALGGLLEHISNQGASLCVNGDAMDFLAYDIVKLSRDLQHAIEALKKYWRHDQKIYYVLGNHDIFLETYLDETGLFSVVPFLEVMSGDKLIHIEHGHLNDFLFLYFPSLYLEIPSMMARWIKVFPNLVSLYDRLEWFLCTLTNKEMRELKNADVDLPSSLQMAEALFARGFDAVILGHTHRHCFQIFTDDRVYANAGTWTKDIIYYIDIDRGSISLRRWPEG